MNEYLRSTDIVDWEHPRVRALALQLASETGNDVCVLAKRCFEWVRDSIPHSLDGDYGDRVACSASEVLEARTGICYAKSHLLAALLRANGIPAGFCYQRYRKDAPEDGFALHGFNAVHLPGIGWYRVDARGNKPGVDSRFTPPEERLAFAATVDGERVFPDVLSDPLAAAVSALRSAHGIRQLLDLLPDAESLA